MKLLLVFAFLAAASAAEIRVQPLVLPEPPKPEVYDAVNIVEEAAPVEDDNMYSVNFVDIAELPNDASLRFEMIDISPLILPDEIVQLLRENQESFADFDAVRIVDVADNAVQAVDAPVDAVQVVDAPIDAVQIVDLPLEQGSDNFFLVPDIGFELPVQIVEAPLDDVQVDPVVIVDSAQNEMPLEYRRDLPVYDNPLLR